MEIVRLPQLELYWSTKHDLVRQHISVVMPLVRFQQMLHLNNIVDQICVGQPGYDPVFKVRKLLDIGICQFEQEYNLNESKVLVRQ